MIQTLISNQVALLRLPSVLELMGKSRSTLYKNISEGTMTKPVNIGGGRVGWPSNEPHAINKARIKGASDDDVRKLVADLHDQRKA